MGSSIQTSKTWSYAPFYTASFSNIVMGAVIPTDIFMINNPTILGSSTATILEIHKVIISGTTTLQPAVDFNLFRRDVTLSVTAFANSAVLSKHDSRSPTSVVVSGTDIGMWSTVACAVGAATPGQIAGVRATLPLITQPAWSFTWDFNGNIPPITLRPTATGKSSLCLNTLGMIATTLATVSLQVTWCERSGVY